MTRQSRHTLLSSLFALTVSVAACHHDSDCVTCVDQRTPTPIPPALTDLSGQWTGSIREDASPCADSGRPVTAQVVQDGPRITVTFSSAGSCSHGEETTYHGTLGGYALSGFLQSSRPYKDGSCGLYGQADGTVSEQRIQIIGSLGGTCHSQPAVNANVAYNITRTQRRPDTRNSSDE